MSRGGAQSRRATFAPPCVAEFFTKLAENIQRRTVAPSSTNEDVSSDFPSIAESGDTMIDQPNQQGTTSILIASAALSAVLLATRTVSAQAPPAETPPAPPPAAAPPATPPPAEPVPAAAPVAAAAPEPTPPADPPAVVAPGTAPPVPALPEEEKKPETFTITTGFGVRFGMQMQDLRRPKQMDMLSVDEMYVEPRFSGKVLSFVGWTANFAVDGRTATTAVGRAGAADTPPPAGAPVIFEVRAMDLIAQLDFMDEFHLWGGRMLTPSDRTNFSGPWFISPWDYPGVYNVTAPAGSGLGGFAYVGPRGTEEIGREVGAVAWGDIGKGKFKYYAGILDLDDVPTNTPLYTGRLAYAFIGSEPGFYGSSTYYGAQNILALGAAAQYQKRFVFAGTSDDVFEFNADLLAEFKIGGTISAEGAVYLVDSGDSAGVMPFDTAFFGVLSYLTEDPIGPGRIQPLFRYQAAMNDDGGPDMSIIEGYVNYVMKDYFAKLALGFQHTDLDNGIEGNAVQFGFQIQQ